MSLQNFLEEEYNINSEVFNFCQNTKTKITDKINEINEVVELNQCKVIKAMQKNNLSETHFRGTTGYGFDDAGREVIDKIYSDVFKTEDALVRYNYVCGTHALSTALFGLLRPGDTLLSATGKPYDTLEEVIGIRGEGSGSLIDFNINYSQIDLLNDNSVDFEKLKESIDKNVKVVAIQRSRGYNWRNSFSVEEIGEIIKFVKNIDDSIICFVDNCYGEFVEKIEPTEVGADICAGSLIKNPGAGIAQTGGYIVGRKDLIQKISYRLTCPGIGRECGATLGFNKDIIQGLFLAPHVVGESLKGAVFISKVFEELGFEVSPVYDQKRSDIIQAIKFNDKDKLITFCQNVQKASPVDSFVLPYPWDMPGYNHQVIMAAGTFVQGASIELSADAPIKSPYIAYIQGGLTFEHIQLAVMLSVQELFNKELINID